MSRNQQLPFIDDDVLYSNVRLVLEAAQRATEEAESKLHSRVVDPFSALFDALRQNLSLAEWVEQEKARQVQKTLQNVLGTFHQKILGGMEGWEDLGTGKLVDLRNVKKEMLAEVKNKYNTTKGNFKVRVYDDLQKALTTHQTYTAYYVEIIPASRTTYDVPFTPSDNQTHKKRPINKKIRRIDGVSFYALASGDREALSKLYFVLPRVIGDILHSNAEELVKDGSFATLFKRAF